LEQATDILEFRRQSFVVRIWLEESGTPGVSQWRGNIVHVPSGDHQYVKDIDEITSFIAKYIGKMAPRVEFQRRFRSWLHWRGKGKWTEE
jgi:hypothetical protein